LEVPVEQMLGDYGAFFEDIVRRLTRIGIDVGVYPVSHVAYRTETRGDYLTLRDRFEELSVANVENQWSGRPISKLLLRAPLPLGERHDVRLIELIPPPHRPGYPMGLEHLGFVIGDEFDSFADQHRTSITSQQDQGPLNQPMLITFDHGRSAKFLRHSLHDVVVMEGRQFDGFQHADE
jgi:predicted metalloenzyme YecM